MFPLFLKNLSFLPSSFSSSQVRKLFTRFQVCEFSSSSSSSSSPCPPPQPPEVSVWWHLDSCPVPSGVSFSKVAPSIMAAVRANGIMGRIHIRAYGDFNSSEVDKEALHSTNITLISFTDSLFFNKKIDTVGKNNFYKHFLMDLNDWVSTNPPPVHLFFIFGNGDFSSNGILHRLRMCNYNILLACPGRPHVALCHAATIMWDWSSMLKREDLTGKHSNYPPDGPFSSWYGNSNMPLENPFSVAELHTSSQNEEIYKPSLDIKLGENIVKILCLHPNGISMGDLRAELTKCDMPLGKRFYGLKKFSDFLISIPHLQLEYLGQGNFWVCLVPSRTSAVKNKQKDGAATQKLNNEGKNMDKSVDGIPGISSLCVEEPKSSELQHDLSHPHKPYWDNFRASVWWDFDSCGVPSDISFLNVAPSIMGVLRANGIKGPIHIDAYGDVSQFSKIKQEALFLSGVDLHHIPGGKNKNKCFTDWLSQSPPPGHLFLISGDEGFDFASKLHRTLWRRKDNFFLACPGKAHGYVCKVATIVWQWSSVLKGNYLTGKYINYPPFWYIKARECARLEYPPGWYRNSKVPHENPFSAAEEPTSSQNAEIRYPLYEVHESVSRKIKKLLSSYPNGISIGDLDLLCRMGFAGGLCGYKFFSNILASIPHVQVLYIGDDNFCVRLIPSTSNVKKKQCAVKNEQRDVNHSGMPVLFSTSSFWDDVESFVFTSRGSRLLSRSRSREDMAHRLQKHGPLFLRSLTENKILQLVELLIAEKKLLEEDPSVMVQPNYEDESDEEDMDEIWFKRNTTRPKWLLKKV